MELPNLPRQNKAQESKASLKFKEWIEKNPRHTCSIEMKDSRGKNSLPFREVKQAQIDYGMKIKSTKGVWIRVQALHEGMPDYIWMRSEPAYVVIKYPDCITVIDIETFVLERDRCKKASLTQTRAKDISVIVIPNRPL